MSKTNELKFNLTELDLAHLALQRTGPLFAMGGNAAFVRWQQSGDIGGLIDFFRTNSAGQFVKGVIAEIQQDCETILRMGPRNVSKATSIGPGLCILDLLLQRHWNCSFYLVDIEQSAEHQHGFASHGSGYANLDSAVRFFTDNGVPRDLLKTCNPRKQKLDDSPVDLVISILSMGFHYPLNEYVEYIRSALSSGGILIFDKRKNVGDPGWESLAKGFSVETSLDYGKFHRLACRKLA